MEDMLRALVKLRTLNAVAYGRVPPAMAPLLRQYEGLAEMMADDIRRSLKGQTKTLEAIQYNLENLDNIDAAFREHLIASLFPEPAVATTSEG